VHNRLGYTSLRLSGHGWLRTRLRSCRRLPSSQRNAESVSKIGIVGGFVTAEMCLAGGRGVSKGRSACYVSNPMAYTSCDSYLMLEVSFCARTRDGTGPHGWYA
jgi:hypothetical protein